MIETLSLFRPLNDSLIHLLENLTPEEWNKKTVAGNWTVKDVVAHLLDVNIRFISLYRDQHQVSPTEAINSYLDLVNYLNRLNAEWVIAMKRTSPALLIEFHQQTHEAYVTGLEMLDLQAPAMFSVAWAGQETSPNWFHIARDFTEKWHHQQQIRDAVHKPGILTKEFYVPVLDTFMVALPFRYKDITAPTGTRIELIIESSAGGTWYLEKTEKEWMLSEEKDLPSTTKVSIPTEISWKLFTKAVQYVDVKNLISVKGEERLGLPILNMITVMS